MKDVFIVDAVRTAIGKYGGTLSVVRPDDLAATIIQGLLKRNDWLPHSEIEEVIFGAANQSGEDNRNVARMAALLAGLPIEVAGVTVNRLCASGLQAIADASRAIKCGEGNVIIAGGVESMSRAPMVLAKAIAAFDRGQQIFDTTIGWRFINPALSKRYHPFSMGETAENVAVQWKVSREEQDAFALQSQQRYQAAHEAGKFEDELYSVEVSNGKSTSLFSKDEHPRMSSMEQLATLKPAFKKDGSVTAGNSSGINDGAAATIVCDESTLMRFSVKPLARVVAAAAAGVDPACMGVGPVPAVKKVLQRAGLRISDIGLVELNEAFASQSIACMRDLNLDPSMVNVNGGAIAIGHPLGCSGTRITATLLHEMKRRKVQYGIATMCIGVGQGMAVLYENLNR